MDQRPNDFGSTTSNPYPAAGQVPAEGPQSWPMPAPRRRRHPVLSHAAVGVVALIVGAGIGSTGNGTTATSAQAAPAATTKAAPAATHAATPAAASPKAAAPKTTAAAPRTSAPHTSAPHTSAPVSVPGDGQYLVGVNMQAGTYRSAGPADDSLGVCYWERDKNASGDFDAIIANDDLPGSGIVTVNRGEYFKSSGCQNWVRVN